MITGRSSPTPIAVTLIRPSRGWVAIDMRELWSYRELAFFFVWRDLKVRYKQTVFGVVWAVLQPLGLVVVFSLFLGRISGIGPPGVPYTLFVFCGLVPWTLFAKGLGASSDSLLSASNLLQKVYFPRLLLPLAALGSHIVDFVVALTVLVILLLFSGYPPSLNALLVVPFAALLLVVALASGIWLSAATVRYRDIRYVVPFLIQLWLFASPVAYSLAIVPPAWLPLYRLNPVVPAIEGFRWALLGEPPPPLDAVAIAVVVSVFLLVAGAAYFRRVERTFADVI
jgi:lipopolysaccharide transport system permease protein